MALACLAAAVSVFRLFGGRDQGWLLFCFVLQQYKQSILLVHLVVKGEFYFKFQLSWKLLSLEGAWVPCFKGVNGNGVLIGGTGTSTLTQVCAGSEESLGQAQSREVKLDVMICSSQVLLEISSFLGIQCLTNPANRHSLFHWPVS